MAFGFRAFVAVLFLLLTFGAQPERSAARRTVPDGIGVEAQSQPSRTFDHESLRPERRVCESIGADEDSSSDERHALDAVATTATDVLIVSAAWSKTSWLLAGALAGNGRLSTRQSRGPPSRA